MEWEGMLPMVLNVTDAAVPLMETRKYLSKYCKSCNSEIAGHLLVGHLHIST